MKRRTRKEAPVMTRKNIQFNQGNGSLLVSVSNAVSVADYVHNVLTLKTIVRKNGRLLDYERPVFNPVDTTQIRETRKSTLKELKSAWKALVGTNYKPRTFVKVW